ncbi:MAG: hypothetical protein J7539_12720 [Niabella sp.]|nr:hypothetical protein [Niabella sp.]
MKQTTTISLDHNKAVAALEEFTEWFPLSETIENLSMSLTNYTGLNDKNELECSDKVVNDQCFFHTKLINLMAALYGAIEDHPAISIEDRRDKLVQALEKIKAARA